ncbi:ABC transporter substrate-binding protein [Paenibacillus sp. IITD108]|uniref:ABC transporter substrate-binding protein n=1 Tax=Paenibacillus sp. IITD108 TaxID=3116649 RepID=UPI002F423508
MRKKLFVSKSVWKSWFVLLAAVIMLAGCSTGKGNEGNKSSQTEGSSTPSQTEKKTDTDEKVTLRWVFPGPGKQKDSEEVWAAFNEKLKEYLPNTTVSFEVYPVAEYADNWRLLAASGEAIDLAWMGYVQDVAAEINKGSYMALDNLLDSESPITKQLPDWLMNLAKFDGKQYGIPNFQNVADVRMGIRIPKEFVDKGYIDPAEAEQIFTQYGVNSKEAYNVIEQYLANLKEKDELRLGASTFSFNWAPGDRHGSLGAPFTLRGDFKDAGSLRVVNIYDTPEMKLMYDTAADWFKKGYIRKDILSVQNPRTDEGKPDGYVYWIHNVSADQANFDSERYGFPIEVIPMEQEDYITRPIYNTMTGITRTSKHPERAMQLLELMHTKEGKELYNLLVWGLEGKHYKKVSDDRIETIGYAGQGTADANYGLWKWVMGNTANSYETQADPAGFNEMWQKLNEEAIKSPVLEFKPNSEPVKTEIAQVQAVVKEYSASLQSGALPDHEKQYADFVEKMKKAGSDKVVQEYQRQLEQFISTQK